MTYEEELIQEGLEPEAMVAVATGRSDLQRAALRLQQRLRGIDSRHLRRTDRLERA
jgi:hypothetical protein